MKIVCKTNEEWRHERAKSVGASAIGILVGESPFMTPMELAERMKAELQGHFDFTQNLAMMRGHAYEQGVADLFSWVTGKELIKASAAEYIIRREEYPFMHCSPDRAYWIDPNGKQSESNKGIVQCKTTRRPVDAENPPLSWQFQLQYEMGICGYREGYLAWDVLSSAEGFGYHRYDFDKEVFDVIVDIVREFWFDCVVGDKIPDPVNASDVVHRWPTSVEGKVRDVDGDTFELWRKLKETREEVKSLQEKADEIEEKIKLSFEDDEAIQYDGHVLATYKTFAGRTTIDSKLLKERYPEAYAKCSKVGKGGRTLRLKDI